MTGEPTRTVVLLRRWHDGDRVALNELLARDLAWIRGQVRRRLGDLLGERETADDYVHDAMVKVLSYGPQFVVSDKDEFRGLMVRLIENLLRDKADYYRAERRDAARQRDLPRDSVLDLDPPRRAVTRPSTAASRDEEETWIRLGVELLEPEDRRLVIMRVWDRLPFGDIAGGLDLKESTARMRFNAALKRLADKVVALRSGRLGQELGG